MEVIAQKPHVTTWVLIAIGVLLLLGAFFVMRNNDDGNNVNLEQELADCERNLALAYEGFATGTPATSTGQDLQALIARCADIIEQAKDAS